MIKFKDVLISEKLNRNGKCLDFVRLVGVRDAMELGKQLDHIRIGNMKIHI